MQGKAPGPSGQKESEPCVPNANGSRDQCHVPWCGMPVTYKQVHPRGIVTGYSCEWDKEGLGGWVVPVDEPVHKRD